MSTNGDYRRGRIFRVEPPRVRRNLVCLGLVSLFVPSLLTLTLAGAGLPATGAATSTLITPGVAIGAIRLGMSVHEVTAILGSATPGKDGQVKFPRWGMTVSFVDGVASRIWTANRQFRTKYGAGVGISPQEATRLVGDPNSVVTRTGGSSTILYPFQGIGFVFSADRAIAVFIKPPLVLGGTSGRYGSTSSSGSGGTSGRGGTAPSTSGIIATPSGSGGTAPSGSTGTALSGSTGTTTSGSAGGSPTVSVNGDGNLVVNGVPFLLIQGTNTDYGWWYAASYTQAQADTKMDQMVKSGFNTNYTTWATMDQYWPGGDPTQYQDLLMWKLHGLYQNGSARTDDQMQGNYADYGILNNPDIVRIMNRFKSRPNLLLWWIDGEYNPDSTPAAQYCTGANTVKGQDPTRSWGDVVLNGISTAKWETFLGCMPVAWVEAAIAFERADGTVHGTGTTFSQLYDGLGVVNKAWNDGYRFVLGFSTTPIAELDPAANGSTLDCSTYYNAMRPPTQAEIHRYFMYQVANNVRAFDILWAPNQRCSAVPRGDNLALAYLTTWNNAMTEMSRVRSLESVILAPGRWQPVVTTPVFVPYAPSSTGNDFKGVYAAKKTVGGKTYIIACNLDFHEDPVNVDQWTENAISNAKIDVGRGIHSVTRLFESAAPPSFSGSVITDSFVPMSVHVYLVQ